MSGNAVRETLAALGVIASMVFVGAEIRQNTVATRAATRQALSDQSIDLQKAFAADAEIAEQAWRWIRWEGDPPERTSDDFPRFTFLIVAALQQRENVFLQAQEGVIGERALRSYGWSRGGLWRTAPFGVLWANNRDLFDPDFVAAFEAEYNLAP